MGPKFLIFGSTFEGPWGYHADNVKKHMEDYDWPPYKISCPLITLLGRNP